MLDSANQSLDPTLCDSNILNTKIGILLIHGLTGTPLEMKPLTRYLKRLGYTVEVPMLSGHGAGHEELLATKWQDWLNGVRQSLNKLTVECEQVVIVGLSVGGLLGVMLASESSRVNSLVLLSVALGIPGTNTPASRHLLPLMFKFPFLRRYIFWREEPPYGLKDKRLQRNITRTIEASKRRETIRYGLFRTYVDTLYQHKLLEQEVCKKANKVTCPTLIVHSLEDTMLSIQNATKMYGYLGTNHKSIKLITGCDHVMTVDLRKDDVARIVGDFISNITEAETNNIKVKNIKIKDKDFTCEVYPYLNPLSRSDWKKLFPALPDPPEMITLTQRSGFDGFNFHSILVKYEERPILLLPLFETTYNISDMLNLNARKLFHSIANHLPKLLSPKILGVGFVEGEWGQIGFDQAIDKNILSSAWDMALETLHSLSTGLDIDINSFICFNTESGKTIPINKLKDFTNVSGLPCAQLEIKFNNLEEYINSLSSSMRKDLRRKMRVAADVKIIRTKNIKPHLDTIYNYYLNLVEKCDLVLGVHRPSFFEHVCELVPGAEYVLYFIGEKLIGFKLNIVNQEYLLDKYFGMDPALGKTYSIYFISMLENIRYCIEKQIPLLNAGQSEKELKARFGFSFIPSLILFKHKNLFVHNLLGIFKKQLSYESTTPLTNVELGTYWKNLI